MRSATPPLLCALGVVLGPVVALAIFAAGPAAAEQMLVRVAEGLQRPVALAAPPGDTQRVFVAEQLSGKILIMRLADYSIEPDPVLTIDNLQTGHEQGLLGLAFHPRYDENGYLYVHIGGRESLVLRIRISEQGGSASSVDVTTIIAVDQPQANHNGGWIGFGPDGMLYIAIGDGGGSFDDGAGHAAATGNAQNLTDNLLGKILRIDVNGDDFPNDSRRNYAIPSDNPFVGVEGDDEIWVYGLRNPFRSSFDRETGDLYIADVGQNRCEELNIQPAGSRGGENYGWRLREGTDATPQVGGPAPRDAVNPVFDYPHPGLLQECSVKVDGIVGVSITGGYVYRGPNTALRGRYFFADFGTAELWSLRWDRSHPSFFNGSNYTDLINHSDDSRFRPDVGRIDAIPSFGEDAAGNLYVLDLFDGEIYLIPEPSGDAQRLAGLAALAWLAARARRTRGRV